MSEITNFINPYPNLNSMSPKKEIQYALWDYASKILQLDYLWPWDWRKQFELSNDVSLGNIMCNIVYEDAKDCRHCNLQNNPSCTDIVGGYYTSLRNNKLDDAREYAEVMRDIWKDRIVNIKKKHQIIDRCFEEKYLHRSDKKLTVEEALNTNVINPTIPFPHLDSGIGIHSIYQLIWHYAKLNPIHINDWEWDWKNQFKFPAYWSIAHITCGFIQNKGALESINTICSVCEHNARICKKVCSRYDEFITDNQPGRAQTLAELMVNFWNLESCITEIESFLNSTKEHPLRLFPKLPAVKTTTTVKKQTSKPAAENYLIDPNTVKIDYPEVLDCPGWNELIWVYVYINARQKDSLWIRGLNDLVSTYPDKISNFAYFFCTEAEQKSIKCSDIDVCHHCRIEKECKNSNIFKHLKAAIVSKKIKRIENIAEILYHASIAKG